MPTNWKQIVELGLKAGFGVCVAAFLLWFIVVKMDSKVDRITDSQMKIQQQNETVIDQMWQLISVGQATCLAVSTTSEERRACVSVDRRRGQ